MAAARKELAENGALDNIRTNLVNEKTLNFLFDESEKVDPPEEEAEEAPAVADAIEATADKE